MRPRLSVSRSAVELIKAFEGFREKAARLDDGRWTIGYGHTLTAREGAEITEPDAEALLLYDVIAASHAVNELIFAPLTQNQFDALVSFVFNIGVLGFRGSPTLRRLNEGRPLEAAMAMELWRKSDLEGERIVIDALVRRRAAEKALFLKPEDGWMPAPTPVLPPKLDYDALGMIPLTSPVAARATTAGDRVYVERQPDTPHPVPPEAPSATEAAASAAIQRLEAILQRPASPGPGATEPTVAPALAETPLVEPATEPLEPPVFGRAEPIEPAPTRDARRDLPPITFLEASGARRPFWSGMVGVLILGLVGASLLALAAVWGFQPTSHPVA
ncbi:MAG TPA: glycoside hydrolase family protein, partial [Caulobacteraceae bacterium]|nr:glycoside hydrolase family protein [Caulobacteraceae bacterium]